MAIGVIIPAAGSSRRFSDASEFPRSKLDEDLGGRPVLQRTVELFTKHDVVASVIVAGPHDPAAFTEFTMRHGDKLGMLGAKLCRGGPSHRYETVAAALALVPESCTHIAVHDAARPCAPPELIDRLFDAAARHPAVAPAVEVSDTLKKTARRAAGAAEADPLDAILGAPRARSGDVRIAAGTLDRSGLVAVQTPQVFEAGLLRRAYAQADLASTDDAQLVERLGVEVVLIEGDPRNIKITLPVDIGLARAILGVRGPEGRPTHLKF
jgi:2-C-methyl-D-erythritol 4-phosphate cytidylyltransferase